MDVQQKKGFSHQKLVARIRNYLAKENKGSTGDYVDTQSLVEHLQECYREYKRRKRNAFSLLVIKALDSIRTDQKSATSRNEKELWKKVSSKRQRNVGTSESSDSDPDKLVMYEDTNAMNSSIRSMYKDVNKTQDTNAMNSSLRSMYKDVNKTQDTNAMNSSLRSMYKDASKTQSPKPSETPPATQLQRNTSLKILSEEDTEADSSNTIVSDNISKSWYLDYGSLIKTSSVKSREVADGVPQDKKLCNNSLELSSVSHKQANQTPNTEEPLVRKKRKRLLEEDKVKKAAGIVLQTSSVNFSDFGGNDKMLEELSYQLEEFFRPEIYREVDITPSRGFLLHGPPGCGKSLLANCIAGHLSVQLLKVGSTELVSGVSGDSEQKIRELFEQAVACAPCVVFIDEIDCIAPKRENASKDMERRIVTQLMLCMDALNSQSVSVLVLGATNRPDSIDPALRVPGRFDIEISLGIPDEKAREAILCKLCRKMRLSKDFDFKTIAHATPGFVGGDLVALKRQAGLLAVKRCSRLSKDKHSGSNSSESAIQPWVAPILPVNACEAETRCLTEEELQCLTLSTQDFMEVLKKVQPSAKREGFATVPDVTWNDIGALHDVRDVLNTAILGPVRYPEMCASFGLEGASGVLLVGPPGCGKTLVAKAVANESGINFISVKGPELMNMYVGESERAVRQVFQRARNSAPCVIFFDELDSLCPRRSDQENQSSARVVNQLLTELDGLETRKQVYIMAATNRVDIIDPAILRPGRLDKIVHVGMPSPLDRLEILRTITKDGSKPCLDQDVDLKAIAENSLCDGFSGADLAALVREAATIAMKEILKSDDPTICGKRVVTRAHFNQALSAVRPSVSRMTQENYKRAASQIW